MTERAGTSVRVRGLVVGFGSAVAVDHVDLDVAAGELFIILGPSGCGKTTLLRTIAGFHAASAGSVHFGGQDVTRVPAHARGAAMVFQSFALWPHLDVKENVAFGLRQRGRPRREIDLAVEAAFASTKLTGFGKRRIDELSGGEQQRVALARALVVHPRCLLLDEPLSNLDASLRQSMREEIRRICKERKLTAIYVTHDQKEAMAVADRIAVMRAGRVLQVGTPRDVYHSPNAHAVAAFVGTTNLLRGKVVSTSGTEASVETASGAFVGRLAAAFRPAVGDAAWVSIRPESFRSRLDPALPNIVRGKREKTVFLGELNEHRVRASEQTLIVYELHGSRRAAPSHGDETMELQVEVDDVVILPLAEGDPP
jgi:iron(III) transport system ATP-binding protein